MEPILIDTSVWVNYLRAVETKASLYLRKSIGEIPLATCPAIVQEVLQGVVFAKDIRTVENYLDDLKQLISEPYELATESAKLYRKLRQKGVTVRKPNDCLIAIYAIRHDIELLHDDRDFSFIAQHSDLKLVDL